MSATELIRCADLATTVHILIESENGVLNADSIAAIDGVDVLHVGMNDLSMDLGHADDLRHADMLDACKRVIAAARSRGKMAVIGGCADPAQCVEFLNAGAVPVVFAAIDTDVLASGLSQRATQWNQLLQERRNQTQGQTRSNEDSR